MPKISVIVPVYKAEAYLCNCVNSILAQTYEDFEVLLIDDGSPDKSGLICDDYAKKDSRVRVFHKKNGGVSSARNLGLDNAVGEWIYFSDSDDELFLNAFEILTHGLDSDTAYVMAGYVSCCESDKNYYSVTRKEKYIGNRDAITQMFCSDDHRYQGYLWNKLFKSSVIREKGLRFDEQIYFNEDRLFNVIYLLSIDGCRCYHTTQLIYKYFDREGGAMASLNKSYNPKFATDLTAFLRMLVALRKTNDYTNIALCKKASYWSYRNNIQLMREFNSYNQDLDNCMYAKLREHLTILDIIYIRFRRMIGILLKTLSNIYNLWI